jgi:DNA polymerase-3 subunit epsilon
MKILFYDLETTGLTSTDCGIVQLAAIMTELDEHNNLTILDEINIEMCPRSGKRIESVALEVNGYTLSQIRSFKSDSDAFNEFIGFMRKHINRYNKFDKCILAGYNNINFDNAFLRQWFKDNNSNYFGSYFWSTSIDVLAEATRYFIHYRPALINLKLSTMARAVGLKIEQDSLHDALYDVRCTLQIFERILHNGLIKPFDQQKIEEMRTEMLEAAA